MASKAEQPGDDFASALLEIHAEDPERLTHEEVASILFSLSFAGHETTNNLIANTLRRLLDDRSRWERSSASARRWESSRRGWPSKSWRTASPTCAWGPTSRIEFHPNISFRGPRALWVERK